jgi:hypothetical protein
VDLGFVSQHRDEIRHSIALVRPRIDNYEELHIWLMSIQDSEINLRGSKMVGIKHHVSEETL